MSGFTCEIDNSGFGQRRLDRGSLAADRLGDIEDGLRSLIRHLQPVNIVKD